MATIEIRAVPSKGERRNPQLKGLAFNIHGWAMEDRMPKNQDKIVITARAPSSNTYENAIMAANGNQVQSSEIFRSSTTFSIVELAPPTPNTYQYLVIGYIPRVCNKDHLHQNKVGTSKRIGTIRPQNVITWETAAPPVIVVAPMTYKEKRISVRYLALLEPKDELCTPHFISERSHVFFRHEFRCQLNSVAERRMFWQTFVQTTIINLQILFKTMGKDERNSSIKGTRRTEPVAVERELAQSDSMVDPISTSPDRDVGLLNPVPSETKTVVTTLGAITEIHAIEEPAKLRMLNWSETPTQAGSTTYEDPIGPEITSMAKMLQELTQRGAKQQSEKLAAEKAAWKREKCVEEEKLATEKQKLAATEMKLVGEQDAWAISKRHQEEKITARKKWVDVRETKMETMETEMGVRRKKLEERAKELEDREKKIEEREKEFEGTQTLFSQQRNGMLDSVLNGLKRFRELGDDMERDLKKTRAI